MGLGPSWRPDASTGAWVHTAYRLPEPSTAIGAKSTPTLMVLFPLPSSGPAYATSVVQVPGAVWQSVSPGSSGVGTGPGSNPPGNRTTTTPLLLPLASPPE